ncbi:NAD(P)H-dependent oxidoreductase [Phenylobacterium sp.]|uniref:NAD(P)H-dependent oxidoreductase n=1 Tax=Phenylobacterium sp. TaxID=1871053 RepID=UPI0035B0C6C5
MPRRVLVINGHPDPAPERLCAALARAYAEAAAAAGHEVRRIDVGRLDFPLIRSAVAFEQEPPPEPIRQAQLDVTWAEHLVVILPLWLGGAPALFKAFLEQVFRYGFALGKERPMQGLLKGRSVRMIVTMGMPAPVFRLLFGAFGARAVGRGVFWVSGMRPVRQTFVGGVGAGRQDRAVLLARTLGRRAA